MLEELSRGKCSIRVWQVVIQGVVQGVDSGERRCATFTGSSEAALKLYLCTKCRGARYCGLTCQQAAWDAHRAACKRRRAHLG